MMKAVVLHEYQGNIIRAIRGLQMEEREMPGLMEDELLLQISAAPCNPSDLAFIQGGYNVRKVLPAIPGFEGTGKVVGAGSEMLDKKYIGKQLSFFSQSDRGGSWASHIPIRAADCIIVSEDLPAEQAACFAVNPFTAYAMVDLAVKSHAKGIIQNAAGGQLAGFINILADRAGIQVINIVRKEEQLEHMISKGKKHLLWQLDENFRESLSLIAHDLEATIAFDAVGGDLSGHILKAMPEGSTLYLYGALGARTLSGIPAADIIFKGKNLRGFNMNEWKAGLDETTFDNISLELQYLFAAGQLKTEIQGIYNIDNFSEALMQYIRNMSGGKVLLRP